MEQEVVIQILPLERLNWYQLMHLSGMRQINLLKSFLRNIYCLFLDINHESIIKIYVAFFTD